MPTAAAASPQPLYSALLPRQPSHHDPNQPSTSTADSASVMTTKPNANGISLPPNLLRVVNSTTKIGSNKVGFYVILKL